MDEFPYIFTVGSSLVIALMFAGFLLNHLAFVFKLAVTGKPKGGSNE